MAFNSPLQQIVLPNNISIWIKRDDQIDPYISGNKWRKLKYILQDAILQQKNHLVTFGGAYSNHLVATAAAAARNNLKSTAFVRGDEVKNQILFLCRLYGMRLIFTDRDTYRDKRKLSNEHFDDDECAYFVDEGGASAEAVKGCSELIEELHQTFDHIFCSAGTGTTAAGILVGLNQKNLATTLNVIPVLKGGSFIEDEITNYIKDPIHLKLHLEYHFGGYARTTPELIDFIKTFTATTGVMIEPVYTAKMFFAINDLFEKGYLKKGDSVLAIHTGGLLGMMGMMERF